MKTHLKMEIKNKTKNLKQLYLQLPYVRHSIHLPKTFFIRQTFASC